jgi:membrane fusion protein, multidrug efflux system
MRHALFAAFLCFALADSAIAQQQQPTAAPVGVVRAAHKPIARTTDFVGRVEAISRVEIRARITGFLDAVQFKEGDLIKAGAPLYRIEKDCSRPRSSKRKAPWSGAMPRKWHDVVVALLRN